MKPMSTTLTEELKKSKLAVVDTIPGTNDITGNPYDAFWKKVRATPRGKFLRITSTPKNQKLISHALYYRARQSRRNIIVALREKALFVGLK